MLDGNSAKSVDLKMPVCLQLGPRRRHQPIPVSATHSSARLLPQDEHLEQVGHHQTGPIFPVAAPQGMCVLIDFLDAVHQIYPPLCQAHPTYEIYRVKQRWSCRDIKLENTLLESVESGRNPLIKICDFGYSIDDQSSLPKTKVGTPGYTGVSTLLS